MGNGDMEESAFANFFHIFYPSVSCLGVTFIEFNK